jgi:hypothetical protein
MEMKLFAIRYLMKEEICKCTREFILEKNLMNVNFVRKNLLQLEIEMIMREDM